jgi:uncharacterized protein YjlB
VGAYPSGWSFDLCIGAPTEAILRRIGAMELPANNPVCRSA